MSRKEDLGRRKRDCRGYELEGVLFCFSFFPPSPFMYARADRMLRRLFVCLSWNNLLIKGEMGEKHTIVYFCSICFVLQKKLKASKEKYIYIYIYSELYYFLTVFPAQKRLSCPGDREGWSHSAGDGAKNASISFTRIRFPRCFCHEPWMLSRNILPVFPSKCPNIRHSAAPPPPPPRNQLPKPGSR